MKRAPNQPVGDLTLYAGIFCKVWHVPDAGTMLPQHAHEHDHLTLIISGKVTLWRDDAFVSEFNAPATIKVPAREHHRFFTHAPNTVLACIHNADHADATGDPLIFASRPLELED
jgi:mannose-6-phosphate isomerase-like protein (cupin superfamily)